MKEPKTIEEAREAFSELAHQNPSDAFLMMLDELVDLACAGGSLVPNKPVQEAVKLRFYKRVIARLLTQPPRKPTPP